ncbi:MAG: HlyD family efflux transporter periplasmic adaptor subunit [Eubacteriales bacterium]|nr:HlyD family efflux transporter periplasmic adaptor subunit [Eubacteriales bacterium]
MKILKHKKKIIPLALIVIVSLGIFLYGNYNQRYIGVVEATTISQTTEVSGKIIEMPVELGTHVSKGDVIAKIDSTNQEYSYEQLQLTMEKEKTALAELKLGNGNSQAENSVTVAESNYRSAVSSNEKASQDYLNAQSLYDQGAISKDVLDKAKVAADSASNTVAATKAQLDNARSSSSADSTQLDIDKTESQLREMKEDLDKYTILAACNGVVMSKSYDKGDMVSSGYHLVDIAADVEKYFVFYLPVDYINKIGYNQAFQVKNNGKAYDAIVKYIDVESEYTPKDLQTAANKDRESVKIKLLLPDNCTLKPGEEAEIKLKF